MVRRILPLLLSAALSLAAPAVALGFGAATPKPGEAGIRIRIENGLLTLATRDAALQDVLSRIGAVAGFETVPLGELAELPRVSVTFERIPVRDAVKRLLVDTNSIIVHSDATPGSGGSGISRVWLLGRSGRSTVGGNSPVSKASRGTGQPASRDEALNRSESVLRLATRGRPDSPGAKADEKTLEALTGVLRADDAAIVRSRAAIALGALGDERALPALARAIADPSFTVRTQAIGAIGRIGGERAATILGEILLNPGASRTERVVAAQALWSQDSEQARSYLRAAGDDSDEQIRRAANRPPATGTLSITTERVGPASVR